MPILLELEELNLLRPLRLDVSRVLQGPFVRLREFETIDLGLKVEVVCDIKYEVLLGECF